MNDNKLVKVTTDGRVLTLTLDSPANRNALSMPLVEELTVALRGVRESGARAVVLTHTAPAFCSGADLTATGGTRTHGIAELLATLWEVPVPVIAVVGGAVRGGGLGLICGADIVVAASDATFSFSEVLVGAIPATIYPLAAQRLAPQARHILLTGETLNAAQAAQAGLVTVAVDADYVNSATQGYLQALLRSAPKAVAATKQLLRTAPSTLPANSALLREQFIALAEMSNKQFSSAEGREGTLAFAEKRAPRWATNL